MGKLEKLNTIKSTRCKQQKPQIFNFATEPHYILQTRTAVLNNDLKKHFERWYPGLNICDNQTTYLGKAA